MVKTTYAIPLGPYEAPQRVQQLLASHIARTIPPSRTWDGHVGHLTHHTIIAHVYDQLRTTLPPANSQHAHLLRLTPNRVVYSGTPEQIQVIKQATSRGTLTQPKPLTVIDEITPTMAADAALIRSLLREVGGGIRVSQVAYKYGLPVINQAIKENRLVQYGAYLRPTLNPQHT